MTCHQCAMYAQIWAWKKFRIFFKWIENLSSFYCFWPWVFVFQMICDKCNFKTKCHEILVSHVAKKHKQCLKCSLTFMLQDDLLTHLEFVHGENVQCPKCEFKGYPSFELVYHQMIEHGDCGKCTDGIDENHHLKVQHQSRQGLLYRWTKHSILPISTEGRFQTLIMLHKLTQSL